MSITPGPQLAYLQSFGQGTIFPTVFFTRSPTPQDFNGPSGQKYQVGQRWIYNQGSLSASITDVSNANPGVVTALNSFASGQIVYIQGVGGMTELNGNFYTVSDVSGTSFSINADTTLYQAYTSGGTATTYAIAEYVLLGSITQNGVSQANWVLLNQEPPGVSEGVQAIEGDTGIAYPTSGIITVNANNTAKQCGDSVLFAATGSDVTLSVTDADQNTQVGLSSGFTGTSGSKNTALGFETFYQLTTGSDNTAIGYRAGRAYTGAESGNICIGRGTQGIIGESNTLRIGAGTGSGTSELAKSFISGINGVNVSSSTQTVVTMTAGSDQLGTATLTAGTNITITPTANTITIAAADSQAFSVNVQTFTGSGTYTPTAGMDYCTVEMVGGGGGSGGAAATGVGEGAAGAGGGGGEYARGTFSAATIGASQAITIGAGGSAATAGANSGGNGGTTSIGALMTANGGIGGQGGVNVAATVYSGAEGGSGGSGGTGGSFRTTGSPGGTGMAINGSALDIPGFGGSTFFGGGARAVEVSDGIAATSYGGGGSGASSGQNTSARPGGAGAAGFVVITEYIIT